MSAKGKSTGKRGAKPAGKKPRKKAESTDFPATDWEEEAFLGACGIAEGTLEEAKISWEELAAIHDSHAEASGELEATAHYIAERLRQVEQVHSVRSRIKSPRHLVQKVIRKRLENPEREISFRNYQEQITDLVGLRALHLFKEEWRPIHNFVSDHWELRESPTAYVREGDNEAWLKAFEEAGCEVQRHPRKYRSIHYTVASAPGKKKVTAEIQVRTLFEEAWSEIDHRINYPTAVPFEIIGFFLEIFNRLAGSADEMGSFINALLMDLRRRETSAGVLATERDQAMERVEQLVDELEISDAKRKSLQKALETAKEKASRTEGAVMFDPSTHISGSIPISSNISSFTTIPVSSLDYISGLHNTRTCIRCGTQYEDRPGALTISNECPDCRNKLYFSP